MSRLLCQGFKDALLLKPLSSLLRRVQQDRDLTLEIRGDYINIYCKGHNVVELAFGGGTYPALYTQEFTKGLNLPSTLVSASDVDVLLSALPHIKDRISMHAPDGNEIEFEQMLIRANNCERRVNSDYFFIDRQIVTSDRNGRFDLIGIYWPAGSRKRDQTVPLVLAELKYGCNNDIQDLHNQLSQYYGSVASDMSGLASEAQDLLIQKLDLGLIGDWALVDALRTLRISTNIDDVRFLVVLVDYNPRSSLLNRSALGQLPFHNQLDFYAVGFGLWHANRI